VDAVSFSPRMSRARAQLTVWMLLLVLALTVALVLIGKTVLYPQGDSPSGRPTRQPLVAWQVDRTGGTPAAPARAEQLPRSAERHFEAAVDAIAAGKMGLASTHFENMVAASGLDYSIQLGDVHQQAALRDMLFTGGGPAPAFFLRCGGGYLVFRGLYAQPKDAQTDLEKLPYQLRRLGPLVRKVPAR
jgi:hypothetical protein